MNWREFFTLVQIIRHQKGFASSVILFLALFSIGFVTFILLRKPFSTPRQQPSSEFNDSKNWKIYKSNKYSLELAYPPSWQVINAGESKMKLITLIYTNISSDYKNPFNQESTKYTITIYQYDNPEHKTLKEIINYVHFEETQIGSYKAFTTTDESNNLFGRLDIVIPIHRVLVM